MPVAPRFHSGCQVQVSPAGSAGASNQPLGVSRSVRPSPLTSPGADAVAGGLGAEVVLLPNDGPSPALLQAVEDDDVDRVGQDLGLTVAGQVDGHRGLARCRAVDLVIGPLRGRSPGFSTQPTFLPKYEQVTKSVSPSASTSHREGREAVRVGADPGERRGPGAASSRGPRTRCRRRRCRVSPSPSTSKAPAASKMLLGLMSCFRNVGSPARVVGATASSRPRAATAAAG